MKAFEYFTPQEKLEAARRFRALLDVEAAWMQAAYIGSRHDGDVRPCFCLLGAGCVALYPHFYEGVSGNAFEDHGLFLAYDHEAAAFIREAVPELSPYVNIATWQDDPTRKWSEVDAVVAKVVAHYERAAAEAA